MIALRALALLAVVLSFFVGAVIGFVRTPRPEPYEIRYVTTRPTPPAPAPHDSPSRDSKPPSR